MIKLNDAMHLMITAFGDDLDKIRHSWRVMEKVAEGFGEHDVRNDEVLAIAVLHDVVEDTEAELHRFDRPGFNGWILTYKSELYRLSDKQGNALYAITRQEADADDRETYAEYIERLSANKQARIVKVADLHENLSRPTPPHMQGIERRYHRALEVLEPA